MVAVSAELDAVMVGASFAFVTEIVMDWLPVKPTPSVANKFML
jgi:hypothetical protein